MEGTDISELDKRYWVLKAQSKTGIFCEETHPHPLISKFNLIIYNTTHYCHFIEYCSYFVVEETDISELEKRYWVLKAQSKTGRFDQETFKSFVCPPMPETLCEGKKYHRENMSV